MVLIWLLINRNVAFTFGLIFSQHPTGIDGHSDTFAGGLPLNIAEIRGPSWRCLVELSGNSHPVLDSFAGGMPLNLVWAFAFCVVHVAGGGPLKIKFRCCFGLICWRCAAEHFGKSGVPLRIV